MSNKKPVLIFFLAAFIATNFTISKWKIKSKKYFKLNNLIKYQFELSINKLMNIIYSFLDLSKNNIMVDILLLRLFIWFKQNKKDVANKIYSKLFGRRELKQTKWF